MFSRLEGMIDVVLFADRENQGAIIWILHDCCIKLLTNSFKIDFLANLVLYAYLYGLLNGS